MVTVNIALVGDVNAMVDSGAMVCVIRKDVVAKILKEENKFGGHVIGFDRIKVPVVGEISLSVRFEGRTAELQRVKVVENSIYDMILGAEWVEKGRVIIYAEGGRLLAHVRPPALDRTLPAPGESDSSVQNSRLSVASLIVPGLVADIDKRSVRTHPPAKKEEVPGLGLELDWPVLPPYRREYCSAYRRTLDPIMEEALESATPDVFQNFLVSITLGDDIEGKSASFYSHVTKRTVIPPGGMRFIATDVCCKTGETWVVTKSFSSCPSREWIIPNCVVKASKRALYIPVVNLSNQSLQWNKGSPLAAVELLQEPLVQLNMDDDASLRICSLSDSSLHIPIPDDVKKDLLVGETLTGDQREQLFDLLDTHSECFRPDQESKPMHGVEHCIDTGDSQPLGTTLRRTSACERRLISSQVQDMLEKGVIEHSNSPWAAQVVMVPKRDGTRRFCIDYRPINSKTRRDLYPLPRMDEILERVADAGDGKGAKFMSSLDLKNGFWQVPIRK